MLISAKNIEEFQELDGFVDSLDSDLIRKYFSVVRRGSLEEIEFTADNFVGDKIIVPFKSVKKVRVEEIHTLSESNNEVIRETSYKYRIIGFVGNERVVIELNGASKADLEIEFS